MPRVREILRRTALLTALASIAITGCIFSPNEEEIPPPPAIVIDAPGKVIDALSQAYQQRDYNLFISLLANDPARNAEYLFILSEPTEDGETQWGWETEARTHKRMFDPENTDPGDQPVPLDLWLESVNISLNLQANFIERNDLYSKDGGEDGLLDPRIWKTHATTYSTDVFFAMAGELDYQVNGLADFVIIEDLGKSGAEPGRFLLLFWEDLGNPSKAAAAKEPA